MWCGSKDMWCRSKDMWCRSKDMWCASKDMWCASKDMTQLKVFYSSVLDKETRKMADVSDRESIIHSVVYKY